MTIHVSTVGTYHPGLVPDNWTINDTRGYLDAGPSCSECGACECERCPDSFDNGDDSNECIGLSFAYVNMDDGAESLCEDCATKAGITITDCDCS